MDALMAWLPAHVPADDETTLVHGDFRLENMIFHPTQPRVLAVLDWELSTLGHPLADLAYNCIGYHTLSTEGTTLQDVDPSSGIPSEAEYLAAYCRRTGRARFEHWSFCIAFSLFRLAAIAQGIAARAAQGNAASAAAANVGAAARGLADRLVRVASCTITQRPVFFTDSTMVFRSSGQMLRRSMISASIPVSPAAASDTQTIVP